MPGDCNAERRFPGGDADPGPVDPPPPRAVDVRRKVAVPGDRWIRPDAGPEAYGYQVGITVPGSLPVAGPPAEPIRRRPWPSARGRRRLSGLRGALVGAALLLAAFALLAARAPSAHAEDSEAGDSPAAASATGSRVAASPAVPTRSVSSSASSTERAAAPTGRPTTATPRRPEVPAKVEVATPPTAPTPNRHPPVAKPAPAAAPRSTEHESAEPSERPSAPAPAPHTQQPTEQPGRQPSAPDPAPHTHQPTEQPSRQTSAPDPAPAPAPHTQQPTEQPGRQTSAPDPTPLTHQPTEQPGRQTSAPDPTPPTQQPTGTSPGARTPAVDRTPDRPTAPDAAPPDGASSRSGDPTAPSSAGEAVSCPASGVADDRKARPDVGDGKAATKSPAGRHRDRSPGRDVSGTAGTSQRITGAGGGSCGKQDPDPTVASRGGPHTDRPANDTRPADDRHSPVTLTPDGGSAAPTVPAVAAAPPGPPGQDVGPTPVTEEASTAVTVADHRSAAAPRRPLGTATAPAPQRTRRPQITPVRYTWSSATVPCSRCDDGAVEASPLGTGGANPPAPQSGDPPGLPPPAPGPDSPDPTAPVSVLTSATSSSRAAPERALNEPGGGPMMTAALPGSFPFMAAVWSLLRSGSGGSAIVGVADNPAVTPHCLRVLPYAWKPAGSRPQADQRVPRDVPTPHGDPASRSFLPCPR